mgnify:FL=1|jgi:hypothetical protein
MFSFLITPYFQKKLYIASIPIIYKKNILINSENVDNYLSNLKKCHKYYYCIYY